MLVGGLTILGLKCLDSISSLPVGEDWGAREERIPEDETPLSLSISVVQLAVLEVC